MKRCAKCKVDKDESEFYKSNQHKCGLKSNCKLCVLNYQRDRWHLKKPNKIRKRCKYLERGNGIDKIYLTQGKFATVDKEDYDNVIKYQWIFNNRGYVGSGGDGKYILLHRFIMNAPKGKVIDHINGDKLDNRKCNLRICYQIDNIHHQIHISRNNKSGKSGVHWNKAKNKWVSRIDAYGKRINLGFYDYLEDAIDARKQAEMKYLGEFKPLC